MANCEEWQSLNIFEQRDLSGKVLHLIQNSSSHFIKLSEMVRIAEKKGLLQGITINPIAPIEENNIDNGIEK